jgi:hypothetical protein
MRLYGMLALLLFVVASGLAVTISRRTEPVYAGKTASQWLEEGHEDASLAMHEIGPPAMPYIIAKLAQEDPQYGSSLKYRRLWVRLPIFIREVLPKPQTANFDETRACSALLELGPGIVPDLTRELQNKNPAVRAVSALALRSLGERGRNIRRAVPYLQKALEDRNADVVRNAAMALACDHGSPHE